jgi:hypothetical protein
MNTSKNQVPTDKKSFIAQNIGLTYCGQRVINALLQVADFGKNIYPSNKTLAQQAGCSEGYVTEIKRKQLIPLGLIAVKLTRTTKDHSYIEYKINRLYYDPEVRKELKKVYGALCYLSLSLLFSLGVIDNVSYLYPSYSYMKKEYIYNPTETSECNAPKVEPPEDGFFKHEDRPYAQESNWLKQMKSEFRQKQRLLKGEGQKSFYNQQRDTLEEKERIEQEKKALQERIARQRELVAPLVKESLAKEQVLRDAYFAKLTAGGIPGYDCRVPQRVPIKRIKI